MLHACTQRLAQGVSRRQIRTNECLGRAREVAPAAQPSTEALARGGGELPRRTCNQFHRRCGIHWWCCMHCCMKRLAQGVTRRRNPHQWVLRPCLGGSSRCPCLNGGACSRHRCVGKPHVQPTHELYPHPHQRWVRFIHMCCVLLTGRHPPTDPHQSVLGWCAGNAPPVLRWPGHLPCTELSVFRSTPQVGHRPTVDRPSGAFDRESDGQHFWTARDLGFNTPYKNLLNWLHTVFWLSRTCPTLAVVSRSS